jgi:hypothetical protein
LYLSDIEPNKQATKQSIKKSCNPFFHFFSPSQRKSSYICRKLRMLAFEMGMSRVFGQTAVTANGKVVGMEKFVIR